MTMETLWAASALAALTETPDELMECLRCLADEVTGEREAGWLRERGLLEPKVSGRLIWWACPASGWEFGSHHLPAWLYRRLRQGELSESKDCRDYGCVRDAWADLLQALGVGGR